MIKINVFFQKLNFVMVAIYSLNFYTQFHIINDHFSPYKGKKESLYKNN